MAHLDALLAFLPRGGVVGRRATAPADLTAALGHRFARTELLDEALTHGSAASPAAPSFERLEFLGDRVLGLIVADMLMQRFPADSEGDLARRHAALVSRMALVQVAEAIDLAAALHLSPAEAAAGPRVQPTILADACEAVIGALFCDGGLEAAAGFVRRHWSPMINDAAPPRDAKTELQEWAQARGRKLPLYRVVATAGPPHNPVFTVACEVEELEAVQAEGASKRAAEQKAAARMLALAGCDNGDG